MKTNLEVSKQLKEMGVKQESEFYWISGDIVALPTWRIGQRRDIKLGKHQRARDVEMSLSKLRLRRIGTNHKRYGTSSTYAISIIAMEKKTLIIVFGN